MGRWGRRATGAATCHRCLAQLPCASVLLWRGACAPLVPAHPPTHPQHAQRRAHCSRPQGLTARCLAARPAPPSATGCVSSRLGLARRGPPSCEAPCPSESCCSEGRRWVGGGWGEGVRGCRCALGWSLSCRGGPVPQHCAPQKVSAARDAGDGVGCVGVQMGVWGWGMCRRGAPVASHRARQKKVAAASWGSGGFGLGCTGGQAGWPTVPTGRRQLPVHPAVRCQNTPVHEHTNTREPEQVQRRNTTQHSLVETLF